MPIYIELTVGYVDVFSWWHWLVYACLGINFVYILVCALSFDRYKLVENNLTGNFVIVVGNLYGWYKFMGENYKFNEKEKALKVYNVLTGKTEAKTEVHVSKESNQISN